MSKAYAVVFLVAVMGLILFGYGVYAGVYWLAGLGIVVETISFAVLVVQTLYRVYTVYGGGGEYAVAYMVLAVVALILLVVVVVYMLYAGVRILLTP